MATSVELPLQAKTHLPGEAGVWAFIIGDMLIFALLFLDNRHQVIDYQEMFRGTVDGTSVYPREVVKEALARNAAAVLLVHNHPSGIAEPSSADQAITRRLKSALDLVDIRVIDHLIVGQTVTSMASRGLL